MGTSSSFKGPKNKSSLLPSWADTDAGDNDDPLAPPTEVEPQVAPAQPGDHKGQPPASPEPNLPLDEPGSSPPKRVQWSSAKNAMSRFGSNPTNRLALKKAGRSYVRARGGARGATRAAQRGVKAVIGIGRFLSDISRQGFEEALRNAGLLDCIGRPVEEVLAKLADLLAPPGGVIDEAITRKAILDSLCYLYDKLTDEEGNIQNIDALGPEEVKEALLIATQHYIYQKWLNEVGITLEQKEVSEEELIEAELMVKEYVGEAVRVAFSDTDISRFNFNDPAVFQRINSIFLETYNLIEE